MSLLTSLIFANYSNTVLLVVTTKKHWDAIYTEAARIVSGATKLCSIYNKLFIDLGWESIQSRRNTQNILLSY